MKKAGQWKNRMVLALELPPDLAYNETIVTLTGQTEAVIENYKSVFKYTPSEIVIQSFCGKVTISGKNLGTAHSCTEVCRGESDGKYL